MGEKAKAFDLDEYALIMKDLGILTAMEEMLDSMYIIEITMPDGKSDTLASIMFDMIKAAHDASVDVRMELSRQLKDMTEVE